MPMPIPISNATKAILTGFERCSFSVRTAAFRLSSCDLVDKYNDSK